jgi:hypothetical protein
VENPFLFSGKVVPPRQMGFVLQPPLIILCLINFNYIYIYKDMSTINSSLCNHSILAHPCSHSLTDFATTELALGIVTAAITEDPPEPDSTIRDRVEK